MRLTAAALAVLLGTGSQDAARMNELVKKLDSPDWVEQAQAAKDLAKIGRPALDALRPAVMSDSPSARFWASTISEAVLRNSSAAPAPAPEPESAPIANPRGFAPGASDMGSLVFVCNNAAHEPYEATFSRCLTCGKTKRFAYDYGADCYRCAVCKKAYARKDIVCDRCGQPPGGRIPIRMKTAGGL
jgi:hypothetical protein